MVEELINPENENKTGETQKPSEIEPKSIYSVDILRLIRDAQKQHGLRHGDFQRYREIEAYVACMHGYLHFELGLWQSAAENFKKSQIIYENLTKVAQATTGDEELCELYKSKIDELAPSVRYCAYNMGNKSDATIDEVLEIRRAQGAGSLIDLEAFKLSQLQDINVETIEWRNYKIQLRVPEKVRLFIMSLQDLDKSIEQAKDYLCLCEMYSKPFSISKSLFKNI